MTEHPIIFSGDAVRAILAGRKTQTRRPMKPPSPRYSTIVAGGFASTYTTIEAPCPFGSVGDLLWVREAWSYITLAQNERQPDDKWDPQLHMPVRMLYRADEVEIASNWSPSIHMPRWASRLTLRITDVRVERIQEISAADILADTGWFPAGDLPAVVFAGRWDTLYAKRGYGWQSNCWVWVLAFEVIQ
jgi:hypothetical protein